MMGDSVLLIALAGVLVSAAAVAADASPNGADMAKLAKDLNNPTAAIYSVPLQNNFDWGAGPSGDGFQYKLNLQPVLPLNLNSDWKLLTRYVLPIFYQDDVIGTSSQTGLGDTTATFWLSPAKEQQGKPIWGVGPIVQLPTATERELGQGKWGIGPSIILLQQKEGWTYGILANQIWSFAGQSNRSDVSYAFLQPFLSHTNAKHTTYGINSESVYDWESTEWTIPINVFANQLVLVGKMPVTFQVGARYYFDTPPDGPVWGLRIGATLVFK
jgi:hypothetical protein